MNKSLLSDQCHRVIFLIQRQDLTDSSSDYVLLTKCHKMLELYCKDENSSRALSCLKVFVVDACGRYFVSVFTIVRSVRFVEIQTPPGV